MGIFQCHVSFRGSIQTARLAESHGDPWIFLDLSQGRFGSITIKWMTKTWRKKVLEEVGPKMAWTIGYFEFKVTFSFKNRSICCEMMIFSGKTLYLEAPNIDTQQDISTWECYLEWLNILGKTRVGDICKLFVVVSSTPHVSIYI